MSLLGPSGKRQLLKQPVPEIGSLDRERANKQAVPGSADGAVGPQGGLSPSSQVDKSAKEQGDKETSQQRDKSPDRKRRQAAGGRETAAAANALPAQAETSAADPQVDKGTSLQDNKSVRPLSAKRTDYEKKGYYLGLRHQETLDDLAKELRRRGLPDDRSMIVRALVDAAQQRLQDDGGTWIDQLAEFCRNTLPGTTKNRGTRDLP